MLFTEYMSHIDSSGRFQTTLATLAFTVSSLNVDWVFGPITNHKHTFDLSAASSVFGVDFPPFLPSADLFEPLAIVVDGGKHEAILPAAVAIIHRQYPGATKTLPYKYKQAGGKSWEGFTGRDF